VVTSEIRWDGRGGLHPGGNKRWDKEFVTQARRLWNRLAATKPFSGVDEIILKPNGVYAR